jgi:hypothetical protein
MSDNNTINAIILQCRCTAAMIEALGMLSENMIRQSRGESMAYNDEAFFSLIDKHGVHHNAVYGLINQNERDWK